jgi:hypothetical protein
MSTNPPRDVTAKDGPGLKVVEDPGDGASMALAIATTAVEMLCDGLTDGVVVFRHQRAELVNDGACELLATPRSFLLGSEVDEVFARIGLPAPWLLRLRAGDPVTTVPQGGRDPALRLRWLNLPSDSAGELAALVIQDMRLGRALRETEDALALRGPVASEFGTAHSALPAGAILRYLSREVRRCHLDFEELSVLVGAAGDAERAAQISRAIARQLRGADRVGACDPLERPAAQDSGVTVVNFPASAMPLDHVLVVVPCTTAGGRDALAMRLGAVLRGEGHGAFPLGAATLQVRTALRRPGDRPRDGGRALLERALGDLARQRADFPAFEPGRAA